EGMRLLAGAPADLALDGTGLEHAWAFAQPGAWLCTILDSLRQPGLIAAAQPGTDLHATLRPYQETGLNWLWFLNRLGLGACLADDMGLGKTIQVIALLLALKKQKATRPALLVLPASLLANWKAEFEKFAPTLRPLFLHPSQSSAETLAAVAREPARQLANVDAVFTTYTMVQRLDWLTAFEWELVVLDEAQAIKNPTALQTKAVKKLTARARIALTGTPVENRLSDLWSIFDFILPGLLGTAARFKDFVKALQQRTDQQYAPLRALVQPYILRRLKTDRRVITDLPDKTEMSAFCGLTKEQAVLYERTVRDLAETLEHVGGMQRRGAVLAFLMRFKQICNHPSQCLGDDAYAPDHSGKFARLRELCEELAARQERVLVFTQFREITAPLAAFLAGVFGRPGLVLHGGTPVKARQALVAQFQDDDGPPFFVLSLKAGGVGLNLTAASQVIHFDRWWNPAVENQATDRAFRIGQKKNVLVHKFICQGTVEENIDKLIREKSALASNILEGGAETLLTEMTNDELMRLVALDVTKACV
ncbi:MAG: DEAD/DEAH box helicase, partial [bacterium]|nr:DEAD/DEAH box helicase [bacterium]